MTNARRSDFFIQSRNINEHGYECGKKWADKNVVLTIILEGVPSKNNPSICHCMPCVVFMGEGRLAPKINYYIYPSS